MSGEQNEAPNWTSFADLKGQEVVLGQVQPIALRTADPIIWNDDSVSVDISGQTGRVTYVWHPRRPGESSWIAVEVRLLGILTVNAYVRWGQIATVLPKS